MSEYLFPKGLRVLAVDNDRVSLLILEKMLLCCNYEVTVCERGEEALAILREDKSRFDLILCDLHMPKIDGLKLLEVITSETDIPVVMTSEDDRVEAVMKGVIHGACDFLVKPICIEQIGVIWQHVIRRKQNLLANQSNFADNMSRISGPSNENLKKRRCNEEQKQENKEEEEEEDGEANHEYGTKAKKPRIIWTPELHHKFVQAVQQLGAEKAVPKKILECMQQMGVSDLTRENVASHLQKFRLYVRRKNVELQEQSENSSPLLCRKESNSFEQSCHSSAVCDLQAAHPPYNNLAMAIQGQRTFLDPTMTQSRQVNVHTQFGYESKQLLPFLHQPVPMPPQGMQFQNLGQTYNASNIFGHELPRKMFLEGQVMTTDQLSWRHVGASHGYGGSVYDQNREIGNIVAHEQYNNFSVDDVTVNGNLYAPFLKEGRVGGVSQQDSDSEGYLCVYNVDNGFFQET